MVEKNEAIRTYILNIANNLSVQGIRISDSTLENVMKKYFDSLEPLEEIFFKIDKFVEESLEELKMREQQKEEFERKLAQLRAQAKKMNDTRLLTDLELDHMGITLNNQQIDLMMIAASNNATELNNVLERITNVNVSSISTDITEELFVGYRQKVFDLYVNSLVNINDYFMQPNIELMKKIYHLSEIDVLSNDDFVSLLGILKQNGAFNDNEFKELFDALRQTGVLSSENVSFLSQIKKDESGNVGRIISDINMSFGEKSAIIYRALRECRPVEKDGVKSTSLKAYRNLYDEISRNFNSITLDEEGKYYGVTLQNGDFEFSHLQKSLDFARSLGKKVRINTLCFYMDCPKDIYMMDCSEEATKLAKEKLTSYVTGICNFIRDNGYSDTVRSIDVLNELLNRYAMEGDVPYQYRGDILQPKGDPASFDNIAAGWQKHLRLEDLCDVIVEARKILPDTDFMFNDANLEDPSKLPYFVSMIKQIQEYEQRHGVKIIDSIGTQMHVDMNLTKEQIRDMLIGLNSLNLPIEITEFDMCLPEDLLGHMSVDEIEMLKQLKINELCECVTELSQNNEMNIDIRGLTIWSVNDKQNFMVGLKNKDRVRLGQTPYETLYGGYFGSDMRPRKVSLQKKQIFNYHTHTNRCGHASIELEQEYVDMARANGITKLGFSDHVPFTNYEYGAYDERMLCDEVEEYISTIGELKKQNPDIDILCGFEAEFDLSKEKFLGELRDKVDYMILGQHFVSGVDYEGNPNYPLAYAEMLSKAIESGIFDMVAHPDIFMQIRDTMRTDEDKKLFLENARKASRIICEKALEFDIPLEINNRGIEMNQVMSDGELSYPHSLFWKIVEEMQVPVLYGVDAHSSEMFEKSYIGQEFVEKFGLQNLNLLGNDYNPVIARRNNAKLQTSYVHGQRNALTYEAITNDRVLFDMLKKIPDDKFDATLFPEVCGMFVQNLKNKNNQQASLKDQKLIESGNFIMENGSLTNEERHFFLNRINKMIAYNNEVLTNQQGLLEFLPLAVSQAVNFGASSKEDIRGFVGQITEAKFTNDSEKRNAITGSLEQRKKTQSLGNLQKAKEGPVLVKKIGNNLSNKASSSKGYIHMIQLTVIVAFVLGIIVGIAYMIYTISG